MGKNNQSSEFAGTIVEVRAVEDCIRATRKYTEGIGTLRIRHPIQGEGFSSKKFVKHYEVYPDIELNWDMPAGVALDWLWGETFCINILFDYDYRSNKASVILRDEPGVLRQLEKAIPDFRDALRRVGINGRQ